MRVGLRRSHDPAKEGAVASRSSAMVVESSDRRSGWTKDKKPREN